MKKIELLDVLILLFDWYRPVVHTKDHIAVAFAGLTADARVLINRARLQAQSHRLTVEDAYTVEGLVKWVAEKQQVNFNNLFIRLLLTSRK